MPGLESALQALGIDAGVAQPCGRALAELEVHPKLADVKSTRRWHTLQLRWRAICRRPISRSCESGLHVTSADHQAAAFACQYSEVPASGDGSCEVPGPDQWQCSPITVPPLAARGAKPPSRSATS